MLSMDAECKEFDREKKGWQRRETKLLREIEELKGEVEEVFDFNYFNIKENWWSLQLYS